MKTIVGMILAIMLAVSGCSVAAQVTQRLDLDVKRAGELGAKYGAPEIAQCANWLDGALGGQTGLLQEPTAGLISSAIKLYLLKNQVSANEAAFKANCGAFAAGVMIEVGKQGLSALPGGRALLP